MSMLCYRKLTGMLGELVLQDSGLCNKEINKLINEENLAILFIFMFFYILYDL